MVAILYCRKRSVYHELAVDCWDEARDARLFPGGQPVVAHPPCRMWGRYAYKARGSEQERLLAFHALKAVRQNGGVLEHPNGSQLWRVAGLPRPGEPPDLFGGYTICVNQVDWGHRAIKSTLLYIVGVGMAELPPRPAAGVPATTVERLCRAEREATPREFATWLVQVAALARTYSLVDMCI